MIDNNNIPTITFSKEEDTTVEAMAHLACVGGKSLIFQDQGERDERLLEDQLTGQYGELAIHKFLFGDEEGFIRYQKFREEQNKHKYVSNGVSDIWFPECPSFKVDSKTSFMRRSQDPLRYNLVVRPKDLHKDTNYVQLLRPNTKESQILLAGWCLTKELPMHTNTSGVFRGAYVKPVTTLNPIDELL